jgi:hypothetical protein
MDEKTKVSSRLLHHVQEEDTILMIMRDLQRNGTEKCLPLNMKIEVLSIASWAAA